MWEMSEDREVLVGQPKQYPPELVTRLRIPFESGGCVESAYPVQFYDPNSGEPPHNLIGVFMKPRAAKAFRDFVPEMGAVINQVSKSGEFVDIVDLSTVGELANHMTSSTKPFYP